MKFVDAYELGIRDIKKHKMRFCFNILSIVIILLVISILMSFALTLNAIIQEDMRHHLIENENSITVFLGMRMKRNLLIYLEIMESLDI